MKIGDILYRVEWSTGFGPKHVDWCDQCTMEEDGFGPSVKIQTWRVNSIQRKRRTRSKIFRTLSSEKAEHRTVFLRRFDHGHGVTFKTRFGEVVSHKFDKTRDRMYGHEFIEGHRPNVFRPTKRGALQAAAASVRKNHWYLKGEDKEIFEKMRTRLLKQAEKF